MVSKKKLFAVIFASLFTTIFVVGVFANPFIKDFINDDNSAGVQPGALSQEPSSSSAYSMPSVGMRWWETYSNTVVSRTSTAYANLMSKSIVTPAYYGHIEVRLSLEFKHSRYDNMVLNCRAVRGTTWYSAKPAATWIGRGNYYGTYQSRSFSWVFENMPPGTYTVYIQWRVMTSGHRSYVAARIMTITWYIR